MNVLGLPRRRVWSLMALSRPCKALERPINTGRPSVVAAICYGPRRRPLHSGGALKALGACLPCVASRCLDSAHNSHQQQAPVLHHHLPNALSCASQQGSRLRPANLDLGHTPLPPLYKRDHFRPATPSGIPAPLPHPLACQPCCNRHLAVACRCCFSCTCHQYPLLLLSHATCQWLAQRLGSRTIVPVVSRGVTAAGRRRGPAQPRWPRCARCGPPRLRRAWRPRTAAQSPGWPPRCCPAPAWRERAQRAHVYRFVCASSQLGWPLGTARHKEARPGVKRGRSDLAGSNDATWYERS